MGGCFTLYVGIYKYNCHVTGQEHKRKKVGINLGLLPKMGKNFIMNTDNLIWNINLRLWYKEFTIHDLKPKLNYSY